MVVHNTFNVDASGGDPEKILDAILALRFVAVSRSDSCRT